MTDLSAFPITQQMARPAPRPAPALFAADAQRRQGLDHAGGDRPALRAAPGELRRRNDQMSPEFLSLNPNNKIPAILDPDGPGGKPLALFESGAILLYLADKTGQLHAAGRRPAATRRIQWLMFQMGGIGPMFGQVGFFHKFAGKDYEDKRPRDRYVAEVQAPARRARQAPRGPRLDHGRRLHHRRHRHLPLGAQPDRLLRGRRAGGYQEFPATSRGCWRRSSRARRWCAA